MANDAELIGRLKKSDNNAFAEVLAIYKRQVINICYRFLLHKEDAEDVSQEVFIEVFNSIGNFKEDSKLGTWIYRIAVSKSLDELKRRSRKKRISSIGKTLGLEKLTNLLSGSDRPDKVLEEKEDFEFLLKALDRLHENQRIALTLSKIEGYSNKEIAEIMQTSITAVESLVYRGRQNLKLFLNS